MTLRQITESFMTQFDAKIDEYIALESAINRRKHALANAYVCESGDTTEILAIMEAAGEADSRQQKGILTSLFEIIGNLIARIGEAVAKLFGGELKLEAKGQMLKSAGANAKGTIDIDFDPEKDQAALAELMKDLDKLDLDNMSPEDIDEAIKSAKEKFNKNRKSGKGNAAKIAIPLASVCVVVGGGIAAYKTDFLNFQTNMKKMQEWFKNKFGKGGSSDNDDNDSTDTEAEGKKDTQSGSGSLWDSVNADGSASTAEVVPAEKISELKKMADEFVNEFTNTKGEFYIGSGGTVNESSVRALCDTATDVKTAYNELVNKVKAMNINHDNGGEAIEKEIIKRCRNQATSHITTIRNRVNGFKYAKKEDKTSDLKTIDDASAGLDDTLKPVVGSVSDADLKKASDTINDFTNSLTKIVSTWQTKQNTSGAKETALKDIDAKVEAVKKQISAAKSFLASKNVDDNSKKYEAAIKEAVANFEKMVERSRQMVGKNKSLSNTDNDSEEAKIFRQVYADTVQMWNELVEAFSDNVHVMDFAAQELITQKLLNAEDWPDIKYVNDVIRTMTGAEKNLAGKGGHNDGTVNAISTTQSGKNTRTRETNSINDFNKRDQKTIKDIANRSQRNASKISEGESAHGKLS